MDDASWTSLAEIILDGLADGLCDELYVKKVLESLNPPSLSHDTRHQAGRRWLVEHAEYRDLAARETKRLIRALAGRFRRVDEENHAVLETLRGLRPAATQLELGDELLALCNAAAASFESTLGDVDWDSLDRWLAERPAAGSPGAALLAQALVNRGWTKGRLGDTPGAMADYTAVIKMPDAPAEQEALALYNRGVVKGRSGNALGAIADYTTIIVIPDMPAEQKAMARVNRGVARSKSGDTVGAMGDCTAVIKMPDAPEEAKERARQLRDELQGGSDE